jgi:hypothetical protein
MRASGVDTAPPQQIDACRSPGRTFQKHAIESDMSVLVPAVQPHQLMDVSSVKPGSCGCSSARRRRRVR